MACNIKSIHIFWDSLYALKMHQLTQVYPNHHATQSIVLAVTQCVSHTTLNLGNRMHHVDPTIDVLTFFRVKNYFFQNCSKLPENHFRTITRSDILQGQALFRGVKQLRRCLLMLNNFEKFSFPSIEKR